MRKIVALIDANVYIYLLLRYASGWENSNQRIKNFHTHLQITNEFIHESIHDEVVNILVKNFGTKKTKLITSVFKRTEYYTTIRSSNKDLEVVENVLDDNPTKWHDDYLIHKGIGNADAKFILAAKKIAKEEKFDRFVIWTQDKPLLKALLNPKYNLKSHVNQIIYPFDQRINSVQDL
jgi:hypothetical protein